MRKRRFPYTSRYGSENARISTYFHLRNKQQNLLGNLYGVPVHHQTLLPKTHYELNSIELKKNRNLKSV